MRLPTSDGADAACMVTGFLPAIDKTFGTVEESGIKVLLFKDVKEKACTLCNGKQACLLSSDNPTPWPHHHQHHHHHAGVVCSVFCESEGHEAEVLGTFPQKSLLGNKACLGFRASTLIPKRNASAKDANNEGSCARIRNQVNECTND
eukprot:4491933-Amphidinium_carterae.1